MITEEQLRKKVQDLSEFIGKPLQLDKNIRGYCVDERMNNSGGVRRFIDGRYTKPELANLIETYFKGYTDALDDMRTKKQ